MLHIGPGYVSQGKPLCNQPCKVTFPQTNKLLEINLLRIIGTDGTMGKKLLLTRYILKGPLLTSDSAYLVCCPVFKY